MAASEPGPEDVRRDTRPPGALRLGSIAGAEIYISSSWFLIAALLTIQGVALMAFGVLVIGLIDNLLRPKLVGKDTRMPDYVVLISTIGGLTVFGISGFIIGPVIAAMFIAVWGIYADERSSGPH